MIGAATRCSSCAAIAARRSAARNCSIVRGKCCCERSRAASVCGRTFATSWPRVSRRPIAACTLRASSLESRVRKTTKLLNALQKVLLPRIERDIRAIVDGLEEEERDDAVRRRVAIMNAGHVQP